MNRFHRASLLAVALAAGLAASPARAAGVLSQSFATMAAFQASPFYDYVVNQLPGGPAANCSWLVTNVAQGDAAVPWSSAGAPLNATVTAEVETALDGAPTVFSGSTDTTSYHKQFVSIGNETQGGGTPQTQLAIPPINLPSAGGFLGIYELAVIDLGDALVPASGSRNSERTTFRIEDSTAPLSYLVAQITNTGGNYINVLLLDLDGIPGAPSTVDRLDIVDASGHNPPQKGSLDIDGVIRLTDNAVPTLSTTWGRMKSAYR
jgi:hypothetical protein